MAKGLKLKVRKFWGLIPAFAEVTEENLVGGPFCPPHILNGVKVYESDIFLPRINNETFRISFEIV